MVNHNYTRQAIQRCRTTLHQDAVQMLLMTDWLGGTSR